MADDPKSTMLPAVTITAKRTNPKKYRTVREKVSVYPNKEVDKYKVDSLINTGKGDLIGKPLKRRGMSDMYSAEQGDSIFKMLKK